MKEDWMIGLTSLEVYNSIFNITGENNKSELSNFPQSKIGVISYTKVRDEIGKNLGIADYTATDLQDDIKGAFIIEEFKEQASERTKSEQYMKILATYTRSVSQDFESFLTREIDLVEDDIKLILDECNSSFVAYGISSGFYTFREISEALFKILHFKYPDSSSDIVIEVDDSTRKTKLVANSGIIAIRFDDKLFFNTVLDFTPRGDYKHYNKYTDGKILNFSGTKKYI